MAGEKVKVAGTAITPQEEAATIFLSDSEINY